MDFETLTELSTVMSELMSEGYNAKLAARIIADKNGLTVDEKIHLFEYVTGLSYFSKG